VVVSDFALRFSKEVNRRLEKRGVMAWEWELDPTDNCHGEYPVFKEDGEQLFKEKEELFKKLNCLLCRARRGPCQAETCFFKEGRK